jgi:hypothetical protein
MDRLAPIPYRGLILFGKINKLTLLSTDLFVSIPKRVSGGKLSHYYSP